MKSIKLKTGRWNWDFPTTAKGANPFRRGDGLEGLKNVGPGIWTKKEDKIRDIHTLNGRLSGGLVSFGRIKYIRHVEARAVKCADS